MAVCLQMPAAVPLCNNVSSPTDTPVQKYEVQVGAGIWHINDSPPAPLFPQVSTPVQPEKHLSSNCLQTATVLNSIKYIADNKGSIKQQLSTGACLPVAHRVTARRQRFFKVKSLLSSEQDEAAGLDRFIQRRNIFGY